MPCSQQVRVLMIILRHALWQVIAMWGEPKGLSQSPLPLKTRPPVHISGLRGLQAINAFSFSKIITLTPWVNLDHHLSFYEVKGVHFDVRLWPHFSLERPFSGIQTHIPYTYKNEWKRHKNISALVWVSDFVSVKHFKVYQFSLPYHLKLQICCCPLPTG